MGRSRPWARRRRTIRSLFETLRLWSRDREGFAIVVEVAADDQNGGAEVTREQQHEKDNQDRVRGVKSRVGGEAAEAEILEVSLGEVHKFLGRVGSEVLKGFEQSHDLFGLFLHVRLGDVKFRFVAQPVR